VRIWDARPPADLAAQILWLAAAEFDPLSDAERRQLGVPGTDPAPDSSGGPDSLARRAEEEELAAIGEPEPAHRYQGLLQAFALYSTAAEQARLQGRSDDRYRHWCYRRASLAHLLARAGLMRQVAESFEAARKPAGSSGG
jgi:hypothetical protein